MKSLRIAAFVCLASGAFAASHIHDTLTLNDGVSRMYGSIAVTGPNGGPSPPTTQQIPIGANGVVDFNLIGCPGCKYTATYNLTTPEGVRVSQYQETWIVPDTNSTLTVKELWGGSSAPYYLISREQVNPAGLLPGQLWLWNGTHYAAAYPSTSADAASINGTSVQANTAPDQVLVTTAPAVSAWVSLANCVAAGRVLRYDTSTHGFSCPSLGASDIPDLSSIYEAKDSTILRTANFAGGGSALTVAHSDHNHAGVYEPVDVTILRRANLAGSGVAITPARSDHNHAGVYETATLNGSSLASGTYCLSVDGSGNKTWITPCPGGGGGGGGALRWPLLTNTDWTTMGNSQWTSMSN